jgi:hypothetical protein
LPIIVRWRQSVSVSPRCQRSRWPPSSRRRCARPSCEERAQVLDRLEHRERIARESHLGHVAAVDPAAVGDADDAAGGKGRRGPVDERHDGREQAVVLDDRVGVDTADERARRCVDTRVQRVRPAAVALVDHNEVRVRLRAVHGTDRCGRELGAQRLVDAAQTEPLDHPRERVVGRSVVGEDDLVLGVFERQHRLDGVDDRPCLVERRNADRDGDRDR